MIEGQIALAARGYLPQTWDALANSTFFGEGLLDAKRSYVKFLLFGTVVDTALESVFYNPLVLEYAAKGLAITIIPAAADWYANEITSVVSTGTSENRAYPDKISSLWRIHARLLLEMAEMQEQVQEFVPLANDPMIPFLPSNTGEGLDYLGHDPHCFPHSDNTPRRHDYTWTSWEDSLA